MALQISPESQARINEMIEIGDERLNCVETVGYSRGGEAGAWVIILHTYAAKNTSSRQCSVRTMN